MYGKPQFLLRECTNLAPININMLCTIHNLTKKRRISKTQILAFFFISKGETFVVQFMLGVTRDFLLLFKEATTLSSTQFPSMTSAGKFRSKNAPPNFSILGLFREEQAL